MVMKFTTIIIEIIIDVSAIIITINVIMIATIDVAITITVVAIAIIIDVFIIAIVVATITIEIVIIGDLELNTIFIVDFNKVVSLLILIFSIEGHPQPDDY